MVPHVELRRKFKHNNRTKIRHPIFVVISLLCLTILNFSSGIPLPQAPVSPVVTPPTAASNSNGATTKKISTHGVFNSWLCGAGYIYDRVTKMCNAQVSLSKNISATHLTGSANPAGRALPGGGQTGNPGSQTNPLTAEAGSAETAEDVQAAQENISSFFPLECGINYRYLKASKICKPKTAPASSESDENKKGRSSSEE